MGANKPKMGAHCFKVSPNVPPYLAYSPPYLAYSQILGIPPPCLAYSAPNLLPHFFGLTALPGIEESQLTLREPEKYIPKVAPQLSEKAYNVSN